MSVFTNPASGAAERATEYVSAVLDLVGDAEPLAIFRATPSRIADLVHGLSRSQIEQPEAAGKWSIRDVLQHLADSELVWGWRLRLVISQDRPPLTGYDQDAWAQRLHYQDADPDEAIATFRMLREAHVRLMERLTPADLRRVGVHAERGEQDLATMMRLYAGHDLLHLNQIARIRGAVVP